MEASRRRAFAGFRIKWTVSFQLSNSLSDRNTTLPLPLCRVTTMGSPLLTASSM